MRSVITAYAQLWAGQENLPIDQFADAGASAFKVEGDVVHVKYATQRFKNRVVVGRDFAVLEDGHQQAGDVPSAAFADAYFKQHLAFFKQAPKAYWNVWPNEPEVSPTNLAALNAYYVRLAELFAGAGLRMAGGAFSAESRLYDKVTPFLPALKAFKKYGHLLDLHGYFSPHLNDPAGEEFIFPHRKLAQVVGVANMPNVFYGEFGADKNFTLNRPYDGWRNCPGLSYEEYANELYWADAQLAADPLVTGAAVYLWCKSTDAEPDKAAYDISSRGRNESASITDLLVQYVWTHPGADYIPGPAVPPVEPPPVVVPPDPTPANSWYVSQVDGLNVRTGPGTTYTRIWQLVEGEVVEVKEVVNGWAHLVGRAQYPNAYSCVAQNGVTYLTKVQ